MSTKVCEFEKSIPVANAEVMIDGEVEANGFYTLDSLAVYSDLQRDKPMIQVVMNYGDDGGALAAFVSREEAFDLAKALIEACDAHFDEYFRPSRALGTVNG